MGSVLLYLIGIQNMETAWANRTRISPIVSGLMEKSAAEIPMDLCHGYATNSLYGKFRNLTVVFTPSSITAPYGAK